MAVHVVGKRDAVLQPHCLQRHDVIPSVFPFYHVRIEKVTAVVVEACDKAPPLIHVRRPAVLGGIMLNQFSGVVGDYLTIVMLPFGFLEVESPFLALSIMVGTDTS
jgi:hypothetical protein